MRFNVLFDWICRIPTNASGYAATESIVHRWIYSAQNWQSERERENPAGHHGDCSHSRHSLVSHIHIPSSKLSLDYNFELCCTVIPSTIPTHMSSIQIASQKRNAKNAVKCYICHLARVHACAWACVLAAWQWRRLLWQLYVISKSLFRQTTCHGCRIHKRFFGVQPTEFCWISNRGNRSGIVTPSMSVISWLCAHWEK